MELIQINQGLERVLSSVSKIQADYATAKAKFENLDEQKKGVLAAVSMKHEGSETKINRMSLQDPDYTGYVKGLNEARMDFLKAQANKNALEVQLSALQTLSKNYLTDHNAHRITT